MNSRIKTFHEMFSELLGGTNFDVLAKAAALVSKTYADDKQILAAGNGGSAALADYLAADYGKNVSPTDKPPRILSLCCNHSTVTALGNDCGYDNVFSFQLRRLLNPGDLVILISSSGNAPNIIKAAEFAKSSQAAILGMTGFSGGKLKDLADINLHVPCNVHELVEAIHAFFCHSIVYAGKRVTRYQ